MRLLVINTVTDPALERVRRRFPGKVFQRPTIAGTPLPPAGRRVLPVEMLKPDVVDHLEYLVSIGNVRVIELGGLRTQVDFNSLRTTLGYLVRESGAAEVAVPTEAPAPQVEAAPVIPEPPAPPVDTSPAVPLGAVEEPAVSSERTESESLEEALVRIDDARASDIDSMLAAAGEEKVPAPVEELVPGPGEKFELPTDIDALIRSSKNKPLMSALALFGKNGAGKNKLVLIDEVGACFAGDPDPVIANRALALLRDGS